MTNFDYLIVGYGLAGATLDWQLRRLGQRVGIIDARAPNSSSRIAAGLISPITGQRHRVSHRFEEFWNTAVPFYRDIEQATGQDLLVQSPSLRILPSAQLKALREESDTRRYLGPDIELPNPFCAGTGQSVFQLQHAARLHVGAYLDASRRLADNEQRYFETTLDYPTDVTWDTDIIQVKRLGITTHKLIFCLGIAASESQQDLFGKLPFQPAKGQVVELRIPGLECEETIIGNVWVVPQGTQRCWVGATYETNFDSDLPTEAGERDLLQQFSDVCKSDYEVHANRAAIRPIMKGRLPQIGVSPNDSRFGFFNGLGSKGALRAPEVARQFAALLVKNKPVDTEFWLDAAPGMQPRRRLTQVAQERVRDHLKPGDWVIDATAGNGYDTLFLAETVGPNGHVYAVDLQTEAVNRTKARLQDAGHSHATCVLGSHADLLSILPKDCEGKIMAIMFNLGYLPRGDKSLTTQPTSTVAALKASLSLLATGGILTILAYTGHPGGMDEARAIEAFLADLTSDQEHHVERPPTKLEAGSPRFYVVQKTKSRPNVGRRI